jgi:UDP-GlcNAc:undecaprenyl-phosphate/decaprenyl-phosphate GlcNAc-1-phosphate transferase
MEFFLVDFIKNMPWWQLMIISTATAFFVTWYTVPVIVTVSKHLGFFEKNKKRGSHNGAVPTLGGVAIFSGIVIAAAIFSPEAIVYQYRYVLAALVILFFTGVKDDMIGIDPKKKLLAQIAVALVMILLADMRITTFHGFLGVEEIPYWVSVAFTIFLYLVIINGFNLIDGIDGLASGVAMLSSLAFGVLFIIAGGYDYAFQAFILIGALAAFFRFNVFSRKNKIFLGDTGSLTIGFIMSLITITFLECEHLGTISKSFGSIPVMAFGILIVPLFDTMRVFVIRSLRGESPFSADRKHIHHRLLDLGFSHLKATLLIIASNLIIIGSILIFRDLRGWILLIIVVGLAAGLSYIPIYLVDRRGD